MDIFTTVVDDHIMATSDLGMFVSIKNIDISPAVVRNYV